MTQDIYILQALDKDCGQRIDKFLSYMLPDLSRARIQNLLNDGVISCNGETVRQASLKVKPHQEYKIIIPEATASYLIPQKMDLDIIYEDEHLLVINKQAGLTVHPAVGNPDHTLVNALLAHCGDSLSGIGGVARPGIVHRLDKDTSGLMVVAKNDTSHARLSAQLADHTLGRIYSAIVWGTPSKVCGEISGNIGRCPSNRQKMAVVKNGGKEAHTNYKLIKSLQSGLLSLVECQLKTGRTHQIRVHFLHIGHPLLGDPTYGTSTSSRLRQNLYKNLSDKMRDNILGFNRQALHARELHFIHPATNEKMMFSCPLPADICKTLEILS